MKDEIYLYFISYDQCRPSEKSTHSTADISFGSLSSVYFRHQVLYILVPDQ